ncbi:phosphoethanolamine--lipid A transferase [Pelomonas sp. CA6]|uniref:phosphoethanolamine transferase n=1 Tax=Pelomonas sp. CA6 TaxID=2907999 RepID=UPI001F4AAA5A|nr:phosphoethanolamine--lipid A transferase [Pelomonas sp. CA6]MCH7342181.1 phosphoethanolamine--lipid A transferase [Pelomonas sp. CA6]
MRDLRTALQPRAARFSPLNLAWIAALWMGTVGNWPLWQRMLGMSEFAEPKGRLFVLVFAAIVCALLGALASLLAWRPVVKPALTAMLLITAVLAHFMGSYGVVIDATMITNALQTDVRETRDLLGLRMVASVLVIAALPAWWLWRQPLKDSSWARRISWNLGGLVLGLIAAVLLALTSFADLSSTMRNHKSLRYMISPVNALWGVGVVAAESQRKPKGPPEAIGLDAKLAPRAEGAKPPLVMLVVGETARAANFSLNGYAKPTNPELAKLPVLSFRNVSSCGTSTAASLPCMFSPLGREVYTDLKPHQESLMDVLQRAGLAVLWLDNQSGCKGICDRVPNAQAINPARADHPLPQGLCGADGECLDEALLHDLEARIAQLDPQRVARGVVLVLHQMGSHGPAYYKRTPPDRKPFQPECRSNALQQCPVDEVRNAYDNTIAYTDRVLASAVRWLETQQDRFAPSLAYVSDHGESLGEKNLFLHGMPYSVAPQEQKHVPMVLWLPEASSRAAGVDRACLAQRLDTPLSHDGLFHTVLSLAGVQTQLYRKDWDWVGACRI